MFTLRGELKKLDGRRFTEVGMLRVLSKMLLEHFSEVPADINRRDCLRFALKKGWIVEGRPHHFAVSIC